MKLHLKTSLKMFTKIQKNVQNFREKLPIWK